ncbi:MAG: hypothetical protein WKF97_15600 [Chitinophagaceae bacterium]
MKTIIIKIFLLIGFEVSDVSRKFAPNVEAFKQLGRSVLRLPRPMLNL